MFPDWLTTATASDASDGKGVLSPEIRALSSGVRIVGRAFTIQASRDDNTPVKDATKVPPPAGSILVVAGHEESRSATLGGQLGLELQLLGVIGIVTSGLVRDSAELATAGLAVWARGVTPIAPQKGAAGAVGLPIAIGGVEIQDGDIVIADDDGVVVWPQKLLESLLTKASARKDVASLREKELDLLRASKRHLASAEILSKDVRSNHQPKSTS